jgi:hypothetical protein
MIGESSRKDQPVSDWPESLDAMTAAPDHHKVLLETERVRVLDSCVAPGQRTPVHTHRWPAVFYVLSWSDFIRYDSAGKPIFDSRTVNSKPEIGAALWSSSLGAHWVENIGTQDLRVIAVELKMPFPL